MVDIPGNSTTTATMTVGGSTSGSLETVGDHDWYRITLTAGQQIVINLASPDFDCYLRIRDAAGNIIFENDDSGGSLNSRVAFQVPSSGTYYIDVGSYNDGGSGAFTLSVDPYTLPPTYTNDQIAHQLTDDYWFGDSHHWNVTQGGTITVNLTALTAEGQNYAREALALWTDVLGITFAEVTTGGNIVFDDNQDGAFANATWANGIISRATVNISTTWLDDYRGNGIANYAFQTYIHEIGHALGLGHAGDYNGDASYPYDATFYNDGWPATVMSYFDQRESSYYQGQGFSFSYALSPMVADIIAVGNLYGLSTTTRTGDTTYGFNSNAGRAIYDATTYPTISYTIFDSGGNDTIDYSGFTQNQVLNLNPETYMNVGGRTGTVSIARGVVIENAIGGSGSDTITGNGVANLLVGNAGNDTLDGQAGDDRLRGGAGNDTLIGGGGNDTALYDDALAAVTVNLATGTAQSSAGTVAGIGADSLSGVEGILGSAFGDTLTGDGLSNLIDGGEGDDQIFGGGGADVLTGGLGNDRLDGGAGLDTMTGGVGDDTYVVDDANDVIVEGAGQGSDTIEASVGFNLAVAANVENLTLTGSGDLNGLGNALNNVMTGNSGANSLSGGAGNDNLFGNGGDDVLDGGIGTNLLDGGASVDRVSYASATVGVAVTLAVAGAQATGVSSDTLVSIENLEGSAFADTLTGNSAANLLIGGAGNDTLNGAAGADEMIGGFGDDIYVVDNVGDVVTELAGEGVDEVRTSLTYTLGANVENLRQSGIGAVSGTGNALDNTIRGNDASNALFGVDGADSLFGNGGDDVLDGGAGDDRLNGGDGNDTLTGGSGYDRMYGGTGDDIYMVGDADDYAYENAGEGYDRVIASVDHQLRDNIEILTLTGTAAIGKGNALDNLIVGTDGANRLYGYEGDDRLEGNGGDDYLIGAQGNDTLIGGAGYDRMYGGIGDDIYYVNDATDYAYENAGEGADRVVSSITLALRANIEELALTGSADLRGYGNALDNWLIGNSGANVLYGGDGGDHLDGRDGNDILSGEAGNDLIEGGAGTDRFYGGAGADTFLFRDGDFGGMTSGTADRIHDFSQAEGDRLRLDLVDANVNAAGDQAFSFIGSSAFHGIAGELRAVQQSGVTYVMGDTNGDGQADFWIRLDGLHTLTNSDFIL